MRLTHMLTILAGIACLPFAALAHEDPFDFGSKYYQVSGVEDGDTLNVRAEATARSDTIGELAPGAGPIEVLSTKDGWAQIVSQERNGWVSLRFLKEVDVPVLGETSLPVGLTCFGTEPFWSLSFEADGTAVLDDIILDEPAKFAIGTVQSAAARFHVTWIKLRQNVEERGNALIRRSACSDGMSDALYPYSADISVDIGQDEQRIVTGCCSLPGPDQLRR